MEHMSWEELYGKVKESSDAVKGKSFREYKKSGAPRRFTDLFGESGELLTESGTYEQIYRNALRENEEIAEEQPTEELQEGYTGVKTHVRKNRMIFAEVVKDRFLREIFNNNMTGREAVRVTINRMKLEGLEPAETIDLIEQYLDYDLDGWGIGKESDEN